LIDIAIILLFLLLSLLIGFYSSRHITSFAHYSIWTRSFGSFAICATLSASFIGGGYTMGNAAKVYSVGMIYAFGLLGFSIKEILVALFIAPRMSHYSDCYSVGDMMGKHYGKCVKVITGVFSMLICTGILGAQVSAIGALFTVFFNMSQFLGIIIGFGVILVYAVLGGMRSVVYTDVLQFALIMIGIPLILVFGLYHVGGWSVIEDTVPAAHINPLLQPHSVGLLCMLALTFVFGEILVPPYVQRLFMTKDTIHTRNATFASGVISVPIFLISGVIGLVAYVMNPHLQPNEAIPYVVMHAMPVGIKGLVIAGLLSVIMSSAAGFLNAAAVSFTNDIVLELMPGKRLTNRAILLLARVVAFCIGLGAVVFCMAIHNILDILIYAYNTWSPIILVPLVAAIFGLKVKAKHFYLSGGAGLIATVVWSLGLHEPYQVNSNVLGVGVSFIVFLFAYHLLGKKRPVQAVTDLV
jgi:SSS family solute:Na+ symporter